MFDNTKRVLIIDNIKNSNIQQAIFILKDGQQGLSNAALLKEAKRLINLPERNQHKRLVLKGPAWALIGALASSIIWLILL